MKHLTAVLLILVLSGCFKQHELEPPIYHMYRQWFRIGTPDPGIQYRFYEDGTMVETAESYTKTYTATLDGSCAWLQLGWNTHHWNLQIVEEDKLMVIENKIDTFIIVCK